MEVCVYNSSVKFLGDRTPFLPRPVCGLSGSLKPPPVGAELKLLMSWGGVGAGVNLPEVTFVGGAWLIHWILIPRSIED